MSKQKRVTVKIPNVIKTRFEKLPEKNIGLVIHEFAHVKEHSVEVSHLTMDYVHEIERIAGIIAVNGIDRWVKK